MDVNIPLVLKTVLEDYALPLNGDHIVGHPAPLTPTACRLKVSFIAYCTWLEW